jgi:hypothetical protein
MYILVGIGMVVLYLLAIAIHFRMMAKMLVKDGYATATVVQQSKDMVAAVRNPLLKWFFMAWTKKVLKFMPIPQEEVKHEEIKEEDVIDIDYIIVNS